MKSEAFTLRNGMPVFVYPLPYLESVGLAVGVNYGSIDDRKEINGAAHYLEHMLFKGTKKRSYEQINDEVRGMGAYNNAFTTFENTVYLFRGHSYYFGEMLDILSDMIKNSTLPPKECELERGPVINENLIHQDNPRFFFSDNFGKVLYKKHPAAMPVGGSRESIERVKRKDLLEIYNNSYSPRNMFLVIYGNVKAEAARAASKRYFDGFTGKMPKNKRPIANEPQKKGELIVRKENLKQARVGVGFKCLPYRPDRLREFLSMSVISKILSYRLFDEVREKKGLSYDPSASYYPYSTFGFIGAQAGVEPGNISEAKGIILREFGRMSRGDVTDAEVKSAKTGLKIQYRMLREDTLDMASAISSYKLLTGDYRFVEKLPEMIMTVTMDEVKKYAGKYIDVDNYSMLVLRPA